MCVSGGPLKIPICKSNEVLCFNFCPWSAPWVAESLQDNKGPSINFVISRGEVGQKLTISLSKKTTKRGGGVGKKSPILRRNSLWTAPKVCVKIVTTWDWFSESVGFIYKNNNVMTTSSLIRIAIRPVYVLLSRFYIEFISILSTFYTDRIRIKPG